MAKHHELFEHTADIGLAARADSVSELFEALAEGLAELICAPASVQPTERREVVVSEEEEDREGLLVDFLWRVLGLLEGERFLIASARVSCLDARSVRAELTGETFDSTRHELLHEVKAITWHGLAITQSERGWEARVILDL